ncbi:DNA-methyltransferase [Neomoorella thermoacetica]|uniref:DNA-methyltransferase n=1 Tax=Neomoorella thermoacetica TaxID=1525 RepID=UPI0030D5E2F1
MISLNVKLRCGDCRDLLKSLPDESVDLILTSPPYWSLRDYGLAAETVWGGDPGCAHEWEQQAEGWPNRNGEPRGGEAKRPELNWEKTPSGGAFCRKCGAWWGQLGLEPDWRMYIEHLREIFRECRRVLKKSGNLAVVLGDTFARNPAKGGSGPGSKEQAYPSVCPLAARTDPDKMKLGIPWRVRFVLNDDGWISRDDIIWRKSNCIPSSVRTRFSTVYEAVFRFIKDTTPGPYAQIRSSAPPEIEREFRRRCSAWGSVGVLPLERCETDWRQHLVRLDTYFDLDAVREPHASSSTARYLQRTLPVQTGGPKADASLEATVRKERHSRLIHLAGRERVVRELGLSGGQSPGQEMLFEGWNPDGPERGCEGGKYAATSLRTVIDGLHDNRWPEYFHPYGKNPGDVWTLPTAAFKGAHFAVFPLALAERLVAALCPPGGLVLDPFCGSGTSLLAAARLGRRGLGFEVNPEYAEMARRRVAAEAGQGRICFNGDN